MLTTVPRLPLNTLIAFRAVAELQNLRAAADVLHLTHSAVSQQIRGLEEQLGFALFERRGRRVVVWRQVLSPVTTSRIAAPYTAAGSAATRVFDFAPAALAR